MSSLDASAPLHPDQGFLLPNKAPLDLDTIKAEFYEPPTNPFYKYESGAQSPYGDEAVTLIESLAKEGALVPERFAEDSYGFYKQYKGRLNSLSKKYVELWEGGARWPRCGVTGDSQAHSLVRVPAIVARYYGRPELEERVVDAVRVHQDDQTAIDYAVAYAFILERVVLGASVPEALKWAAFERKPPLYDDIRALVQDSLGEMGKDPREVTMKCAAPRAPSAVFALLPPHSMIAGARRPLRAPRPDPLGTAGTGSAARSRGRSRARSRPASATRSPSSTRCVWQSG